jgi:hypothetical protein
MAKLNSVQKTWDEYGGWVVLLFAAYLLFTFRKVFSSFGEAAGSGAEAVTAAATAKAKTTAAKSSVKAATGSTREPSDAEIAKWTADANSLNAYLQEDRVVSFERKPAEAFGLIKRGYSRLNLYNNKPCKWKDKTHKSIVPQTSETSESIKNAVNWKVLVPFYKEASGGRDLLKDMRMCFTDPAQKALLKWII